MISIKKLQIISLCTLIVALPGCKQKETKIAEPIKQEAISEVEYTTAEAEVQVDPLQFPEIVAEK